MVSGCLTTLHTRAPITRATTCDEILISCLRHSVNDMTVILLKEEQSLMHLENSDLGI